MAYLPLEHRHRLQIRSMEECISKDNTERFVGAFVVQQDLPKLGFIVTEVKTEGRPAFNPKDVFQYPCFKTGRMMVIFDTKVRKNRKPKPFRSNPAPT